MQLLQHVTTPIVCIGLHSELVAQACYDKDDVPKAYCQPHGEQARSEQEAEHVAERWQGQGGLGCWVTIETIVGGRPCNQPELQSRGRRHRVDTTYW